MTRTLALLALTAALAAPTVAFAEGGGSKPKPPEPTTITTTEPAPPTTSAPTTTVPAPTTTIVVLPPPITGPVDPIPPNTTPRTDDCLADENGYGTTRWTFQWCFLDTPAGAFARVVFDMMARYGISQDEAGRLLAALLRSLHS